MAFQDNTAVSPSKNSWSNLYSEKLINFTVSPMKTGSWTGDTYTFVEEEGDEESSMKKERRKEEKIIVVRS